ncbi:exopolysaccharide biosynthesis protein [Aliiruegeria sabulilitoris]|uniref:exopolysaccharide biosynthesis protein n=1 Tax=Aliiruegeria sabulilitoris TaxID=1510458 RepID=UPI0008306EED|nr:exopolysaccharide biosynthesis protein [Aliiruegeria sabulilitoris]NDR55878.1 exopolysaccharide biosynthesis protein [Pseudoruegeria sp. M32A2M]
MNTQNGAGRRPSLSLPILRTSRDHHRAGTLTLGNLLSSLGEASFGWAIVVFSLLTLLPLPPGSSVVTALPLLVTTVQMILGYSHVRLPGPLARLQLDQAKVRRTVLRLRPVTRRLERVLTPRHTTLFAPRYERLSGVFLFVIAFALFLPVPFSGWFPAVSLFTFGVGIVERDGLVALVGLSLGALSVLLTATIMVSLAHGAEAMLL